MDERSHERGTELPDVLTCSATGCRSRGLGVRELDTATGQLVIGAPHGWGVIEAMVGDGTDLVLYVCSRSCERRLAAGLAVPTLGSLG